jgi:hypothetical protein
MPDGHAAGPSLDVALASAFDSSGAGFDALDGPAGNGGLLLGSAAAAVATGAGSGAGSLGRAAEQANEKRTPRSGQHVEERFIADVL